MKKNINLNEINNSLANTMSEFLDIRIIDAGDDFLSSKTMPVNKKTIQPFGILHGGASVVGGNYRKCSR